MNKITKNKKILISIILGVALISLIIGGIFLFIKNNDEKEQNNEITNNYVAYISINPLIKLEYTQTCNEKKCDNPIVTKYELVNDDAKEIYKNIKLNEYTSLSKVLQLICETAKNNNIVFDSVEIYSDWVNLGEYIDENSTSDTWVYNINIKEKEELKDIENTLTESKKILTVEFNTDGGNNIDTIEIEKGTQIKKPTPPTKTGYKFVEWQLNGEKFDFNSNIEENIVLTAKWEKINTTNNNQSNNNKPDTDNNNQNINKPDTDNNSSENPIDVHKGVINLNDNVLYSEGESAYSCENNCIPDSVLTLVKNSKGYYDYNAGYGSTKDYLWYKVIHLSGKYNTPEYKGETINFGSMVLQAGAIFVGGSYDEPHMLLTEEICNMYKLSCDRW